MGNYEFQDGSGSFTSTSFNFMEMKNPYHIFESKSYRWYFDESTIEKIKKQIRSIKNKEIIILKDNLGTGKTRILKRISTTPNILGKEYIPVYLDFRKYIELPADNFLWTIQQEIQESSKDSFDPLLDEKITLVLLFDEFTGFIENTNSEKAKEIIGYIQHFESIYKNYILIFAIDTKIQPAAGTGILHKFFKSGPPIAMEYIRNEKSIEEFITDPVKNYLNYTSESIERIKYLSGNNLYFQQLICYHLVNYLKERYQVHCSKSDVDEAVEQLLADKDKTGEFEFTWDKKFSINNKIVASVLADQRTTREKMNYYFLDAFELIDKMFAGGIYQEIRAMYDTGLLHDIDIREQRSFSRYPFTVPLYGKWVQKQHPYLRTILEYIDGFANRLDIEQLTQRIEDTPARELTPFNKESMVEVSRKWCHLKNKIFKQQTIERADTTEFISSLSKLLTIDFNIVAEDSSNIDYFTIDLRDLNIGGLNLGICFVQDRLEMIQEDIDYIKNVVSARSQKGQAKLAFLFCLQKTTIIERLEQHPYLNFAAIEETDIKKIIFSTRPVTSFRKVLLNWLSPSKISPYKTAGPVKETFYGRIGIIEQITQLKGDSFTIVGPCRIGKSSLLHKIMEILQDDPHLDICCIFMNLQVAFTNTETYDTFLSILNDEIKRVFNEDVDFKGEISRIPEIINRLAKQWNRKVIFILDEIDDLIKFDKKRYYQLIKTFNVMSENKYCQFIMAGFKYLYHGSHEIESSLYKFCDEIQLSTLDRDAALDLITIPMANIGINYENLEDRELILDYTNHHPNLLQFICKNLVKKVEKHKNPKDRRTIFKKDIKELLNKEYENYIMDEIYMFNTDISDRDKLIILAAVEECKNKASFSTHEIKARLKKYNFNIPINLLNKNMQELMMRFIFKKEEKDRYRFSLLNFPDILKNSIDDNLQEDLIQEIQANFPLWDEATTSLSADVRAPKNI